MHTDIWWTASSCSSDLPKTFRDYVLKCNWATTHLPSRAPAAYSSRLGFATAIGSFRGRACFSITSQLATMHSSLLHDQPNTVPLNRQSLGSKVSFVESYVRDRLPGITIQPSLHILDVIDSLRFPAFFSHLEKSFGDAISFDDVSDCKTFADLFLLLEQIPLYAISECAVVNRNTTSMRAAKMCVSAEFVNINDATTDIEVDHRVDGCNAWSFGPTELRESDQNIRKPVRTDYRQEI